VNYLPQWRVNIEEERVVDVPTGHLAKVGFIPAITKMTYNHQEMSTVCTVWSHTQLTSITGRALKVTDSPVLCSFQKEHKTYYGEAFS